MIGQKMFKPNAWSGIDMFDYRCTVEEAFPRVKRVLEEYVATVRL
ncbi:MAG: hypothetical protein QW453_05540 [Thermoprotei archaeon]